MDDTEFTADFWSSLRDTFDDLVQALNTQGRSKAKQKFNKLSQRWEGHHLREYMNFCLSEGGQHSTTSGKYKANREKLDTKLKSAKSFWRLSKASDKADFFFLIFMHAEALFYWHNLRWNGKALNATIAIKTWQKVSHGWLRPKSPDRQRGTLRLRTCPLNMRTLLTSL